MLVFNEILAERLNVGVVEGFNYLGQLACLKCQHTGLEKTQDVLDLSFHTEICCCVQKTLILKANRWCKAWYVCMTNQLDSQ